MPIPFAAHVVRNAPTTVANELDRMPEDQLLAADPEFLVDQFFERLTVRVYDGDLTALRDSHDAVLVAPSPSDGLRVTLRQPGLSEFAPLLSFQPSSGVNIEIHVERDDSLWFSSTVRRLKGDLDGVLGNIRQLNKDVQKENPALRQHITNVVMDRIGKARAELDKRDRAIAEAAADGLRIRRAEDPPPESPPEQPAASRGSSDPDPSGPSATVALRAIPDAVRNAAALAVLEQLERDLNRLLDLGELSEAGLAILEQDAIPLVGALRALLRDEAVTEPERRSLAKNAIVTSGRALQAVVSVGTTVGSVAALAKLPEVLRDGQEVLKSVIDAISAAL
jgi:hypothetical protein